MSYRYISLPQALEIHRRTMDVSGGGSGLIINDGQLDCVLAQIQNDDYYPEFIDKITHLFFVRINSIVFMMEIRGLLWLFLRISC